MIDKDVAVRIAFTKIKMKVPTMSRYVFEELSPDIAEVEGKLYVRHNGEYSIIGKDADGIYNLATL